MSSLLFVNVAADELTPASESAIFFASSMLICEDTADVVLSVCGGFGSAVAGRLVTTLPVAGKASLLLLKISPVFALISYSYFVSEV